MLNAQHGRFIPTWDSLKTHQTPDWYLDGKFGIFIHWGLYSVPAFGNEWYPRNMYIAGTPEFEHHQRTYGPQDQFGYKDFIPRFQAEKYDPSAWADLFRQAGAKFVVPVAEHHDGFAMYDSALTDWTAAKMGPKRDLIGELAQAVRAQNLVFGLSSHRAEHWFFMNGGRQFNSDVNDERYESFYGPAQVIDTTSWGSRDWQPRPDTQYLENWLARCQELLDKYQPQLFWFDWWIEQLVYQPYLLRFAAGYYNREVDWNKGVAINYKNQAFEEGAAVLDIERGQLNEIRPLFWQNDTSISKNSWGYVRDQNYKTAADLLSDLVDITSKNGALLLNIGPKPDGTIPDEEQAILREIGAWLKINGEAIYGTRPWQVYGEGPTEIPQGSFTDTKRPPYIGQDIRYTTKGRILYATALAWPGNSVTLHALKEPYWTLPKEQIHRVSLLGGPDQLTWSQGADGLTVNLPDQEPDEFPHVIKIEW